jgi:tetratricopeptide (TPR) repeat protein
MAGYAVLLSTESIESAISIYEELLPLRPPGHEQRAVAISDLGDTLFLLYIRHNHRRDDDQADRCLELLREALQLRPPGHPLRHKSLHFLARALFFIRYLEGEGNLDVLTQCIILSRAALDLRPCGHPDRNKSLASLGIALASLFRETGDIQALTESIEMLREDLKLTPPGHLYRTTSLNNLANALKMRFRHQGGLEGLAEAIRLGREALELLPMGHPHRFFSLYGLAWGLMDAYRVQRLPDLLHQAISFHRQLLELDWDRKQHVEVLINLAEALIESFVHTRSKLMLSEAISLLRQCTNMEIPSAMRADIAVQLLACAKYDENEDLPDLQGAIILHRQALEIRTTGHFNRLDSLHALANLLCRPECRSWPEALELFQEARRICAVGNPAHAEVLSDMSKCFLDPESPFFDFSKGLECLSAAYSDSSNHVNQRLASALSNMHRVEIAYDTVAQSRAPLDRMESIGQMLELYALIIGLLPRAANFGLDAETRLKVVVGLDEIVRIAAARATLFDRVPQAVEMLEEGRGVFWSQTLHLRTTGFTGVPAEDREQLIRLFNLLEEGIRPERTLLERERDIERRRKLNEEAEAMISRIRSYPGLSRFLLPVAFDGLMESLPDGFVVILNASKVGHHALMLHRASGLAASLRIEPPRTGFDSASLRARLPRGLQIHSEGEPDTQTRAMRLNNGSIGSLEDVLVSLWTFIVVPVIKKLQLQVRYMLPYSDC